MTTTTIILMNSSHLVRVRPNSEYVTATMIHTNIDDDCFGPRARRELARRVIKKLESQYKCITQ